MCLCNARVMTDQLSNDQVSEATSSLGWRISGSTLRANYATDDFNAGVEFVNRIAAAAQELNHHPDITLTYPEVGITLTSHDVNGLTKRDVELASQISQVAAALGFAVQTPQE